MAYYHNPIGFRSLSNWEDSYFGGYKKVLWDHPEIKTDNTLEWESDDKDLGYYLSGKLVKLFLLQAKTTGYSASLRQFEPSVKVKQYGQKFDRYYVSKHAVDAVVQSLAGARLEKSNLFEHYSKTLKGTRFYIDVPEPEPQNQQNGGEQPSGGDQDENQEKGQQGDQKEQEKQQQEQERFVKQKFNESMDSVEERENKIISHFSWGEAKPKWIVPANRGRCSYTPEEISSAAQLVALLDISFDSDKDILTSLKTGKLDTVKIAESQAGNLNIYSRQEENLKTRPFSVCVLVDESGSMSGSKLNAAKSMMKVLYKAFNEIIPQDRLYFYSHTGHDGPEIITYQDKYNPTFENTVDYLGSHSANNYDAQAIEAITSKIRTQTPDNIIFIVVSDGQPCAYGTSPDPVGQLKQVIEKNSRDGFVTLGVGALFDRPKELYKYHTIVHDLSKFTAQVSMLINRAVKTEFQ